MLIRGALSVNLEDLIQIFLFFSLSISLDSPPPSYFGIHFLDFFFFSSAVDLKIQELFLIPRLINLYIQIKLITVNKKL